RIFAETKTTKAAAPSQAILRPSPGVQDDAGRSRSMTPQLDKLNAMLQPLAHPQTTGDMLGLLIPSGLPNLPFKYALGGLTEGPGTGLTGRTKNVVGNVMGRLFGAGSTQAAKDADMMLGRSGSAARDIALPSQAAGGSDAIDRALQTAR